MNKWQMLTMGWYMLRGGGCLSHDYDPKPKILMNVKSLKYRLAQHTHTYTHMHREHEGCGWGESGGTGVFMGIILWEMLHWVSVGDTATLPLCTPMWAILGQITLLPSGAGAQAALPWFLLPRTEPCACGRELVTQWVERYQIIKNLDCIMCTYTIIY